MLQSDGYTFTLDREKETAAGRVRYWKCSNRKAECKARVIEREQRFETRGVHNHNADSLTTKKRKLLSQVLLFITVKI